MRIMQDRVLPENWVEKIEKYDIENSSLSYNHKIMANALIKNL